MTVRISRALLDRIVLHAAGSHSQEICGLLMGGDDEILDAIAAPNVAPDKEHRFEIDPAILFGAIRAERAGGLRVIGHYHSHPDGIAEPSPRDAEDADGGARLWLVIAAGTATLWRSGRADGLHGCFARVELKIESACVVA